MPRGRVASVSSVVVALAVAALLGPVSVAAASAPVLDVPASVDLGTTRFGHPSTRVVEVGVAGDTAVTFGQTWAQTPSTTPGRSGEFSVTDDTCAGQTVQPSSSCSLSVAFLPYDTGSREGSLLVRDASGSTIGTTALTGVGTEDAEGTYYPTAPTRLLDTRKNGSRTPLAGGSTTTVRLGGRGGVPATGVSAVVVNLTAVATTSQGYFTLYPTGRSRPTASSINFPKGWTGAIMATLPVGADGAVRLYNYGGAAHAVVDVIGWYAADDTVRAGEGMGTMAHLFGEAGRIFDSRVEGGAFRGGEAVEIGVDWGTQEDNDAVESWVVNVTAVGATSSGVVTAWSGQGTKPTASTVNYQTGVVAPNMAVVTSGHDAAGTFFRLDNVGSDSVHLVVDVVGVMLAGQEWGQRFVALDTPTRFLDTRRGLGLSGAFGSRTTRTVDQSPVAPGAISAVVATTTGVQPASRTYLSVWPHYFGERTRTSVLNVEKGAVRSAATYLVSGMSNRFEVYNDAGPMHLVMDAVGVFYSYDRVNGGTGVGPGPMRQRADREAAVGEPRFTALPDAVTVTRR